MPLAEAVERAVNDCIREGILADFLFRNRAEAIEVSIFEYDEEKELALFRAAEREEGREEGRNEELKKGLQVLITTCQELDVSFEETAAKLKEKYSLGDTEVYEVILEIKCRLIEVAKMDQSLRLFWQYIFIISKKIEAKIMKYHIFSCIGWYSMLY